MSHQVPGGVDARGRRFLDLGKRFLDSVLAEVPDAGFVPGSDDLDRMPLADRDERHGGGVAARSFAGAGYAFLHPFQTRGNVLLQGHRTHDGQPGRVERHSSPESQGRPTATILPVPGERRSVP